MKNKEILERMPVGGIVPKRILAAMKRKGLIYDYSRWGYLESARISYKDPDDSWHHYVELFPNGNAREAENFVGTSQELINKFGSGWNDITYMGFTFGTKYLDGCFAPCLIKTGPKNGNEVNHRTCFFGAII